MRNKKAIVGSILINVVGLVIIFVILGAFIGISFIMPKKAFAGTIDKNQQTSSWKEYSMKININFLLNCEGEFHEKKEISYSIFNKWGNNEIQSKDVADFFTNSFCNRGKMIAVKDKEIIMCEREKCGVFNGETGEDYEFLVLPPYNISIYQGGLYEE